MTYVLFEANPWVFPVLMLLVLAIAIEAPTYFGKRLVQHVSANDDTWNVIQGGVLTLVAFMLGISFSQSQARYDARRSLIMGEANSIGTTWLRADQLPAPDTRRFRSILTDYTSIRLNAYRGPLTPATRELAQKQSDGDQTRLWNIVSAAQRAQPGNVGRSLLMESLNDTIDKSAEQLNALTHHVPVTIIAFTLLLVVIGALLIGFGFARSSTHPRILSLAYVLATLLVIEMMVDLDRPQTGFVRVNLEPLQNQLRSMR